MSIGKKSIARAANAAAKAESAEAVKPAEAAEIATLAEAEKKEEPAIEVAPVTESATAEDDVTEAPVKKIPEKFKKVSVGDGMPAFLL